MHGEIQFREETNVLKMWLSWGDVEGIQGREHPNTLPKHGFISNLLASSCRLLRPYGVFVDAG